MRLHPCKYTSFSSQWMVNGSNDEDHSHLIGSDVGAADLKKHKCVLFNHIS